MSKHERLKVMTVVGTRPEIIRLSATIKRLDEFTDHFLVHTGQNYDYELNEVFFEDLGLRKPDYFLNVDASSLGTLLGNVLTKIEPVISSVQPSAVLVLGDTNSSIAALMAKRMKVPVFHMEAGNRCFDENVPEEVNRRMIDHISDYNLVYTEHARRNLLVEGIHPSRIMLTGSPMREVLDMNADAIDASNVVSRQGLTEGNYFLVSIHREENVDNPKRLASLLEAFRRLSSLYNLPVLISTHPRTKKRIESQPDSLKDGLKFHAPFGFNDYVKLQKSARLVLSDSGTISEESNILGFSAVTLRDSIERPEAVDAGAIITAGTHYSSILRAVEATIASTERAADRMPIPEYQVRDFSSRVLRFVIGSVHSHYDRARLHCAD